MSDFWIKYALRVAHIGSMIGICYKTISDFSAGTVSSDNPFLYSILGVVAIISGSFAFIQVSLILFSCNRKKWEKKENHGSPTIISNS